MTAAPCFYLRGLGWCDNLSGLLLPMEINSQIIFCFFNERIKFFHFQILLSLIPISNAIAKKHNFLLFSYNGMLKGDCSLSTGALG